MRHVLIQSFTSWCSSSASPVWLRYAFSLRSNRQSSWDLKVQSHLCCNNEQCCFSQQRVQRHRQYNEQFQRTYYALSILLIQLHVTRDRSALPERNISGIVFNSPLIKTCLSSVSYKNFANEKMVPFISNYSRLFFHFIFSCC